MGAGGSVGCGVWPQVTPRHATSDLGQDPGGDLPGVVGGSPGVTGEICRRNKGARRRPMAVRCALTSAPGASQRNAEADLTHHGARVARVVWYQLSGMDVHAGRAVWTRARGDFARL